MTLNNDPKKSSFLWSMHCLCDAIDLKQSAEATLKLYGKSLATVLDEVHFIVNLYSFFLPLVALANTSFLKVRHYHPPRQNNFRNFPRIPLSVFWLRTSPKNF